MRTLLALLLAACARPYVVPATAVPALGTSHVTGTETITPPNQDAAGRATTTPPSTQATQLVAATKDLDGGLDPAHVARALQALAVALDAVAPTAAADTADLHTAATELPRANAPVEKLRDGLDVAVRVMGVAQAPTEADQERYRSARDDMRNAIMTIDPARTLGDQRVAVVAAFRAAARAVLAVQDAAPPTFEGEASTAQR
jgi:hypothetical protein